MTQTTVTLRPVALPTGHGGWSLTLEPVALGLMVEPGWAGAALGAVAMLGFVSRTPLKLVLVDRRRGRSLTRTGLAGRVAAIELALAGLFLAAAVATAEANFWWPLAAAVPLIGLELCYDKAGGWWPSWPAASAPARWQQRSPSPEALPLQ